MFVRIDMGYTLFKNIYSDKPQVLIISVQTNRVFTLSHAQFIDNLLIEVFKQ